MKTIFIAGHNGLVGSAIKRQLHNHPLVKDCKLITRTRNQLDLLDFKKVLVFFEKQYIDEIYICAAKVGGISANIKFPANFIYENTVINTNIIHAAKLVGINRLLYIGSSCIYPKSLNSPIKENQLLSGSIELTNEAYAIAKIHGLKMCEAYNSQYDSCDFRCVVPTNTYGPNDKFNDVNSHVIPALLSKFITAKKMGISEVTLWGTGSQIREFIYVNDLADAAIHVMNLSKQNYREVLLKNQAHHINIGSSERISIRDLSIMIAKIASFTGRIKNDLSKTDGFSIKTLDSTALYDTGYQPKVSLEEGLKLTYNWYFTRYKKT